MCTGACMQTVGSWRKLTIAVQSGSRWSVIDAVEEVRGYEDNDTRASKKALTYASASGVEIPTLGEVVVPMQTKENTNRSMKLQAREHFRHGNGRGELRPSGRGTNCLTSGSLHKVSQLLASGDGAWQPTSRKSP